jgi:hypothetical protein
MKRASEPWPGLHILSRCRSMLRTPASLSANQIECPNPAAAIVRAHDLWKAVGDTGAVAFSRTGDPATGDFSDATVLRKFGDVPKDLSAL